MTVAAALAHDGFVERFGSAPAGVWSAPGRANLIGEHTDYNEGFVLPFAIDRRCLAAVAPREDRRVRVSTAIEDGLVELDLDRIAPGALTGWAAYPLGVVWGLGRLGAELRRMPGFDVHFVSDVPLGAGLSSSAAIESAIAVALDELWDLGFSREQLVDATHLAENEVAGAPTGILDQSAVLLSAAGSALFLDCRDGSSEQVAFDPSAAGLTVLVIDTNVTHAHVGGGYAARRASCERAAQALGVPALRDVGIHELERARTVLDDETFHRARHIVTEDQRVLDTVAALRAQGPAAIGPLLLASHASLRDDFEISTPELDLAVETAMCAGAIGARMTGGGFGGSAIALVAIADVDAVRAAVEGAFAERGLIAPTCFTVVPSEGARRDE